ACAWSRRAAGHRRGSPAAPRRRPRRRRRRALPLRACPRRAVRPWRQGKPSAMWLLTWNVYGRVRRRPEQAAAVLASEADVIAPQEVTPTTVAGWTQDLEAAGYHVLTTAAGPRPEGRRRLGLLLASP